MSHAIFTHGDGFASTQAILEDDGTVTLRMWKLHDVKTLRQLTRAEAEEKSTEFLEEAQK